MYRKALVPTDGSELSRAALTEVAQVVDREGVVLVVEVIDSPTQIIAQTTPAGFHFGNAMLRPDTLDAITSAQQEMAREHLASASAALAAEGFTDVQTRIREGAPGPELIEVATAEGCDVIIMATNGRTGLTRTFLGSVADHVVRHAGGIPVLLIRPEDPDED